MSSLLPLLPVIIIVAALVVFYIVTFGRNRTNSQKKKHKTQNKDRASILREANKRLAQNPKDPEALLAIGELHYNEAAFDQAMKIYATLVDLCATNPEIDEYEMTVRYALSALKCDQTEEAYKSLLIARSMKDDGFDVNYNLGYLEYLHKNYEKAILLLSHARVLQPEHALTLRFLGHSLFKTKRYAEAAALLRKAIDQAPEDKESLFAVARSYHELGQNEQAIKIFSHLRADPQMGPNAALFAGTIHLQTRQYDQAVMDFQLGLKHEGITPEVVLELKYRLAATYIKQQEIGEAIRLLLELQQASPDYKDVQEQLQKYRELNTNQNLKVFLIAPSSDFVTLCRKMAVAFFPDAKVKITDVSMQTAEYADILADVSAPKWEDIILFRFVRTTGIVGELILRDLYSRIKDVKAGRGFCLTAGTFTEGATQFVEARLIDLVNKDQLMFRLSSLDSARSIELVTDEPAAKGEPAGPKPAGISASAARAAATAAKKP